MEQIGSEAIISLRYLCPGHKKTDIHKAVPYHGIPVCSYEVGSGLKGFPLTENENRRQTLIKAVEIKLYV